MTRPRLRLRHPTLALWRSPGVLQVGLDAPALVLEGVPRGLPLAVSLLARPQGTTDLDRLVPDLDPDWLDWLVARLAGAGMMVPTGTAPVRTAALAGGGALAGAISAALAPSGIALPRRKPAGLVPDPAVDRAAELVVVAGDQAEPDRSLLETLTRGGKPHLVVRLEPDRAVVGPLVQPGRSPCVRCQDLHRCRLDPAWPQLLAQLCQELVVPEPTLLAWAAATAAAQVRAWLAGGVAETAGGSLELGLADFRLRSRNWPAHPRCDCLVPIS